MKKTVLIFIFLFSCVNTAFSLSMGRKGEPFEEKGVMWQLAYFKDANASFEAAFPGKPMTGIANQLYYIASEQDGTVYEINTRMNERFSPPNKLKKFVSMVKEAVGNDAEVFSFDPKQKSVKYAVEVHFYDKQHEKLKEMRRIYCTSNKLYNAFVIGDDFSLAEDFFNHIQIK